MQNGQYQISDLKQTITGILSGISLNNVVDLYGKIQRSTVTVLTKADVAEMQDRYSLSMYDGVFDYTPPATLFGALVQDVRPQGVSRSRLDGSIRRPLKDFDFMKQRVRSGVEIAFEQRGNQQIMRLASARTQPKIVLGSTSTLTGWNEGGSATGLALDQTDYYAFPASLRFNLGAAGGGGLGYLNASINAINLSVPAVYTGVGVIFVAVKLPAPASAFTSIGVLLGSDSNNYYSVSSSTGFLGAFQAGDYILVALSLANASTTGSPNPASITFLQANFNYTSATYIANVRLGGVWIALPTPYEIMFETPAIFIPNGSTTPQKTITADTDSLTIGDAAYQLLAYESSREIALGKGGSIASGMIEAIDLVLEGDANKIGLYNKYRQDNPAETLKVIGSWA